MTFTWTPDTACFDADWETYGETIQERALVLATSTLIMLTNNRVGTPPVTIRPCPSRPPCGHRWYPYVNAAGVWRNSCGCQTSICGSVSEIDLPGPVGYVDVLKIDGVSQDLNTPNWRLDEGHLLVWQGIGTSPVPDYQDLTQPDSAIGTWSVTYSQSYPVGTDAQLAVGYLAMEFAKACKPKGKCSLPQGVTSVVRNGVSFTVAAGLFPNGLTGIEQVDAFILKWAPAGSPVVNAVVFDPSKHAARRTNSVPRRPVSPGFGLDGGTPDMPRQDLIQYRRGTAAQWATSNPVLASGEAGYDSTNHLLKVGDGITDWANLSATSGDATPGTYYGPADQPPPYEGWSWWVVTASSDDPTPIDVRIPAP